MVLALSLPRLCLQTDLLHHNNLIGELPITQSGRAAQDFDSDLFARRDSETDWDLVSMCGCHRRHLRSLTIYVRILRLSTELSIMCIDETNETFPGLFTVC